MSLPKPANVSSGLTCAHSETDALYFIDRAKDLATEIVELRHGFTQSQKQEIKKVAWENLPRLGGMIAATAGGLLLRRTAWGMAAQLLAPLVIGTAAGTLAQVGAKYIQYQWDKEHGKNPEEIDWGNLWLQSANDAFGASMSISIGGGVTVGLGALSSRYGANLLVRMAASNIGRGIIVNETIGAAHAIKNWDATYGIEDVVISAGTGALGGVWAPLLQNRWKSELFCEVNREFGENILQKKFDRCSDGDLTIQNVTESFVLSFAELGGSIKGHRGGIDPDTVASRQGPGTGSTPRLIVGALALAFDVSNYALHSNNQSTNNQHPPVSSAAVLSGISLLRRKKSQIPLRQIPTEGFVTKPTAQTREMELLKAYSVAQESGDVAQCVRALEDLRTFYRHPLHLLRFNGKAGLAWVTDTEQALVKLIREESLFSECVIVTPEGECLFNFPTHLGIPLALRVEGEQLPDIIHLPGQRKGLPMSSTAYFRIDALGKIQNVVSDRKVDAIKAKLRNGLLYAPNTPVVDPDIFSPIHVFLDSIDDSYYIHDGYNRTYGAAEVGHNYILGRLMGQACRGPRPLYDLADIRVIPHDEYVAIGVRQVRDNVIPSYNDPHLYDPPPPSPAVAVAGPVVEEDRDDIQIIGEGLGAFAETLARMGFRAQSDDDTDGTIRAQTPHTCVAVTRDNVINILDQWEQGTQLTYEDIAVLMTFFDLQPGTSTGLETMPLFMSLSEIGALTFKQGTKNKDALYAFLEKYKGNYRELMQALFCRGPVEDYKKKLFYSVLPFSKYLELVEGRSRLHKFLGRNPFFDDPLFRQLGIGNHPYHDSLIGIADIGDGTFKLRVEQGAAAESSGGLEFQIKQGPDLVAKFGVEYGLRDAYIVDIQGGDTDKGAIFNTKQAQDEFRQKFGMHPFVWLGRGVVQHLRTFSGIAIESVIGLDHTLNSSIQEHREASHAFVLDPQAHAIIYRGTYDKLRMRPDSNTPGIYQIGVDRLRQIPGKPIEWQVNGPYYLIQQAFGLIAKPSSAPSSTPQFPFAFDAPTPTTKK